MMILIRNIQYGEIKPFWGPPIKMTAFNIFAFLLYLLQQNQIKIHFKSPILSLICALCRFVF